MVLPWKASSDLNKLRSQSPRKRERESAKQNKTTNKTKTNKTNNTSLRRFKQQGFSPSPTSSLRRNQENVYPFSYKHIKSCPFKIEFLATVLSERQERLGCCPRQSQDAFLNIAIDPSDRKLFGFLFIDASTGRHRFKSLAFGLPWFLGS